MSQGEIVRPSDLGLRSKRSASAADISGTLPRRRRRRSARRLAELIAEGDFGEAALDDETLLMVRDQFRRFAEDHREDAHRWHLKDD